MRETSEAVSLMLAPEPDHADLFAYRPGQFLTLRIPSARTGSVSRCYSLSSAPHEKGPLQITVKRTAEGYASNWLCDNATEGMALEVLPPAGRFIPPSLDTDLLLFAAGSGITPILSILKSILAQGSGHCTLLYANRDERSVIFAGELTRLSARHPDRLRVLHWLESVQGLPTARQLATAIEPWCERDIFVCGPGPYMTTVGTALADLGVDRHRVHMEKFLSLAGNPFDSVAGDDVGALPADVAVAAPSADSVTVTVDLDGETYHLTWQRGKVLLDVLLAEGLDAPYSCREGACSACVCRVTSGEVRMRRNEVLEPSDVDDGYVLACQSIPVSDDISITYS
ncbi:3-ketosteroid 9alpha-monooxygenase subunit B [Nocardia transvalensis]|uniref:3-ketosteroid 9alpha-monooxygenase subunit B n=1 Tax=Nocardia transvalensis TaxID=37333 RepID=A0A7W9UNA1_9NOCA|nr:3-ketosteroid 9alpha-monooxygenase subunit B [Nocardia transvalensis]